MVYSWDYDIAWCADSIDTCTNTDCFRHTANQPKVPENETFVCTWMCLMGTEECPLSGTRGELRRKFLQAKEVK